MISSMPEQMEPARTSRWRRLADRGAVTDLKKIRTRTSYNLFKGWAEFLKKRPSREAILRKLFELLDDRHSFRSATNAKAALESLELVIHEGL